MKRPVIIISMAILLFGVSLNTVIAQELEAPPQDEAAGLVENSHSAVQAYLAREKAFQNKDYDKAWELTSESVRKKRFNNDIGVFKENYSQKPDKLTDKYISIKEAKLINPKEVSIEILSGNIFVMRQENDKWYWAGTIEDVGGK